MPTDHHLDPDEDALVQLGYETEDVEYKKLAKSVMYFFVFVVFCGVAGVAIFGYFIGFNKLTNPPEQTSPFVSRVPPQDTPLLQTNETNRTDIRDLRKEESELLHGAPSWVDKDKGIVRIPIDQAIDKYLSQVAPNAPTATTIKSGTPPVVTAPKEDAPE
jgi:hypothetical protein